MDINEGTASVATLEIVTLSLAESSVDSDDSDSSLCSEYTSTPFIEESAELVTANVSSVQEVAEKPSHTTSIDTNLPKTAELNVSSSFECMKNALEKRILKKCSLESEVLCSQQQITNPEIAEERFITEILEDEVTNRERGEERSIPEISENDKFANREIGEEHCITENILNAAITNREREGEPSVTDVIVNDTVTKRVTDVIVNDTVTKREIGEERCIAELILNPAVTNSEIEEVGSVTEVIINDKGTNREIEEERCIAELILNATVTNSEIGEEGNVTEVILNDKISNREIGEERSIAEFILNPSVGTSEIEERSVTELILNAAVTNSEIEVGSVTEVILNDNVTSSEIGEGCCITELILDAAVTNSVTGEERSVTEVILDDRSCSEERLCVDTEEACFSGVNHGQQYESCSGDPPIKNSEIYPSTEDKESVSDDSGESLPKCRICSKVFDCLNDLTMHLSSVHLGQGLNYVCKICNESFNVKSNFIKHVGESHLKRGSVTDHYYKNNSGTYNRKPVHQLNVKEHFSSGELGLQTHLQSNSDAISVETSKASSSAIAKSKVNTDGLVKCVTCNRGFRNMVLFSIHQRLCQSKGTRHECDICGKTYYSTCAFRYHLKSHMGLQIKCNHCNKVYVRPENLNTHLKKINNQKPYKCYLCSKSYTKSSELKEHLNIKHKQGTPQACEICGKIYYTGACLRKHIKSHSQTVKLHKKLPNEYKCIRCEKTFRGPKLLQNHLSKVNGCLGVQCVSCRECGKSYTDPRNLLSHFKTKHGELLIGIPKRLMYKYILKEDCVFMCEYCGVVIRDRTYFRKHLNCHLHVEQKHVCSQCRRKFTSKESLEAHVKKKHGTQDNDLC